MRPWHVATVLTGGALGLAGLAAWAWWVPGAQSPPFAVMAWEAADRMWGALPGALRPG